MKKKTKGVVLLAFGSHGYAAMAYNMAWSIKHHSPEIPICLIVDECFETLPHDRRGVFDQVIPLDKQYLYSKGKLDPGKVKTSLYWMLPFDHNLYLDVDGIALNDISLTLDLLINDGRFYMTCERGRGKQNENIGYSVWAHNKDIVEHFGLSPEQDLVAIQSSWAFISKSKQAEKFFKEVQAEYEKGFPMDKLIHKWGGGMPDELIFSGVIARNNMNVAGPQNAMFFGESNKESEGEIEATCNFLSLYGNGLGNTVTRLKWWELYDRLMFRWTKEARSKGQGVTHIYKSGIVRQYKHADKRR